MSRYIKWYIFLWLVVLTPYIWNVARFTRCDFESNYKCEVIHGIGAVVFPLSYITVWFDDDRS